MANCILFYHIKPYLTRFNIHKLERLSYFYFVGFILIFKLKVYKKSSKSS